MKRYFYYVASYILNGKTQFSSGLQETTEGYFDFVNAAKYIAQGKEIDAENVIITFWKETNSKMAEKGSKEFKGAEQW